MKRAIGAAAAILALVFLSGATSGPTAYDKQQDARIAALEAKATVVPQGTVGPTLPPTAPPTPSPTPAQVVRQATPATTMATIGAWAADQTVDRIDFQAGTYPHFSLVLRQARTRHLDWTCQPGAIIDGVGASGGAIWLGTLGGLPGSPTATTNDMTFNLTGCTFQNYTLSANGLFMTGWVNDIVFANARVRNVAGSATLSHVVYVESDQSHRGAGVTIAGFDVIGPSDRSLGSGVQVYAHNTPTGTRDVHVIGGTWSNLNRFTYAYSDATGFLLDGVTISAVNVPIEAPNLPPLNQIAGVVRNVHVTGSGANRWDDTLLTDGGGNTYQ